MSHLISKPFTILCSKVIGARFYNHASTTPHPNPSPIDEDGHGSHTSSTIAGASIAGASLYGLAKGTARGGVPSTRIAMYKVCWADGCSDIDLMAGLDDAINDGVDLISISIGGDSTSYFDNPISIGAFHAMKKGILTTCSAGNNGPTLYSVQNTAPWILTVGASGMDRQFRTLVKLGNGIKIAGLSINTFSPNKRMYPLTTAVKAASGSLEQDHFPWLCDEGSLDANKVKGKIVLCKEGLIQDYVKQIGGFGAIVSLQQLSDTGFTFTIPTAYIDANVGDKIEIYVNSTRAPQAVIYKSTAVYNATTPFVASFSSRGPNTISSTIIKPDIVAPGIDILAAYSKLSSVSGDLEDNRFDVLCDEGSLDANKVKGKIVLCKEGLIQDYVKQIGGLGAIVSLQQLSDTGFTFTIPTAYIDANVGDKIEIYVNSTRAPQAVIYKSTAVYNATTPFVASFSSRGPNTISSTIIKPDIVAPGIDILAAYSKLSSVSGDLEDNRFDVYNIISGTSMACPHVAAAAAYVKSFHPNWSPAAIKSALMTTASELKIKDVQAELAYGAGQIDPVRALHPGLIYDMSKSDYIRFLCNEGYSGTALKVLTEGKTNCSSIPDIGGHDALNYPSMYLQLNSANSSISAIFHRTVTNVGLEKAIYKAVVKAPATLKVTVVPKELAFSHLYEKKSFMVVIKGPPLNNISSLSASLEWNDAKHRVKSPIHIFLGI
nr:subtilisin-like protease sbt4.15 [Quercus suber]